MRQGDRRTPWCARGAERSGRVCEAAREEAARRRDDGVVLAEDLGAHQKPPEEVAGREGMTHMRCAEREARGGRRGALGLHAERAPRGLGVARRRECVRAVGRGPVSGERHMAARAGHVGVGRRGVFGQRELHRLWRAAGCVVWKGELVAPSARRGRREARIAQHRVGNRRGRRGRPGGALVFVGQRRSGQRSAVHHVAGDARDAELGPLRRRWS